MAIQVTSETNRIFIKSDTESGSKNYILTNNEQVLVLEKSEADALAEMLGMFSKIHFDEADPDQDQAMNLIMDLAQLYSSLEVEQFS